VCCRQGETGYHAGSRNGYDRNYTYGETGGTSEWCAEIYLDIDLSTDGLGPEFGHSRVLIGAPLWVRNPTLRSIYLYTDYSRDELEKIGEKPRVSSVLLFNGKLKTVRRSGRSWMDRLLGRDGAPTPINQVTITKRTPPGEL
jgi:hypothetical protein